MINCIFCGIENDFIAIQENGYLGRKCSQCGLIYISPRPSYEEITNLYSQDDAQIHSETHISSEFAKRLHAKHNLRIITSYVKDGALLEIGAGAGYFLDEARKIGFEPYGIEFNPIQATFIKNKLGIHCEETTLTGPLFNGRNFDVVYHCDVISHLFDPFNEFRNIYNKTKDGGYLIFETGNLGEVDKKFLKHYQSFQYPDHLFFFGKDNLIELLERTGYEFVKLYRYSILHQLMFRNGLTRIRNLMVGSYRSDKPQRQSFKEKNPSATPDKSPHIESHLKRAMKMGWNYFSYFLIYKFGYVLPKAHRPQTVIVIARKRSQKND